MTKNGSSGVQNRKMKTAILLQYAPESPVKINAVSFETFYMKAGYFLSQNEQPEVQLFQ